jgi:hypothetical protein
MRIIHEWQRTKNTNGDELFVAIRLSFVAIRVLLIRDSFVSIPLAPLFS